MRLTNDNFMIEAMRHYDNSQINTIDEFQSDLNRINCAQKLIERYLKSKPKEINIRLLMNHCIVLHNAFGNLAGPMLKLRFVPEYQGVIRPVVEYLRIVKRNDWEGIGFDMTINSMLEEIDNVAT